MNWMDRSSRGAAAQDQSRQSPPEQRQTSVRLSLKVPSRRLASMTTGVSQ